MPHSLADQIFATCSNPIKYVTSEYKDPNDVRRAGTWLKDRLLQSRRFFLDEDVTHAAATLGIMHPEILLQMLRRARAPFERVWIEWPLAAQVEATGRPFDPSQSPERVGCLVEALDPEKPSYRMTVISYTDTGKHGRFSLISPFSIVYDLEDNQFFPVPRRDMDLMIDAMNVSPDYMQQTLMGSSYTGKVAANKVIDLGLGEGIAVADQMDDAEREFREKQSKHLASHATYCLTPVNAKVWRSLLEGENKFGAGRAMRTLVGEFSGMWRMVISVFALINAQNYVGAEDIYRQGKNRVFGGKIVPYLEHRIVRLKLPREVVVRKMAKDMAEAIPKRRHDVMGHYAQSRKRGNPNCDHAYVNETDLRQRCVLCGHAVWWVKDHKRGTAELGYVTKDYAVTRS